MNLWDRIKAAISRRSTESWGLLDPRLSQAFGIGETSAGITVNARVAEAQSTIFGCVQAISSALASLPVHVYRREGNARIEQPEHPFARIVREGPNDHQTWPDFIEGYMASTLLRGNALAEIEADATGQVSGLAFYQWEHVTVQLMPSSTLRYDVFEPYKTNGNRRRLLQAEVIHLKDRSDDGFIGRSRLSRAAEVVGTAAAASQFAGSFFKNSANPSGAVSYEKSLSEEARGNLRKELDKGYVGAGKAGRVMILDNGLKFDKISFSPEDAELLETRRFGVEELCRIYQVPPPIVQAYEFNTFTNSAQAARWFGQHCITPWCRKLEAVFARAVFEPGSGYEIEFDMSGFLRGDPQERWAAHDIALRNKVLTPNEVREVEGWNPREGGDEFEEPKPKPPIGGLTEEEPEPSIA